MPRTVSIIASMMAMAMLLFTTAVPHHHHDAMICLAHETCQLDGCDNNEHTGHSGEEGEEEDGHCVAHQKYFPSDELRIFMVAVPVAYFPAITFLAGTSGHVSASLHRPEPLSSPPILSWRLNC